MTTEIHHHQPFGCDTPEGGILSYILYYCTWKAYIFFLY